MATAIDCSLVIPVFDEAEILPILHERLTAVMARAGVSYEILLVNDGSRDGSWEIMTELASRDAHVCAVNLSRNHGHQLAITAGIDHARGEAVVVMDADLQDPPEVVLEMLERFRQGYDVVYGQRVRRHGETVFKRATAAMFYRIVRALTSVDLPVDTGDFRLMSRRAVNALRQLRERNRFVRGMVAWVGFRQTAVLYERAPRAAGETKYPLWKMVRFANDAIFSFSFAPLRIASAVGLIVSATSFMFAAFAVYAHLFTTRSLPGWTSLMVGVVFLGGVQLVCLGIIGEYLGRVYDEVKGRPLYLVQEVRRGEQLAGSRPEPVLPSVAAR